MLTMFVLSISLFVNYAISLVNAMETEPQSPVKDKNAIVHHNMIVEYDFMNVFPASSTAKVDGLQGTPPNRQKASKPRKVFKTEEERKEAKRLRDKESKKRKREMLKNSPAGNELKEAKLSYERKRRKAFRIKMAQLPNDDENKQRFRAKDRDAQRRWKAKKRSENKDFFADQQRRRREREKMANATAQE